MGFIAVGRISAPFFVERNFSAEAFLDPLRPLFYPYFGKIGSAYQQRKVKIMDANDKQIAKEMAVGSENIADDPKKRTLEFLKNAVFGCSYALWGYLLGGAMLPYGAMPFGAGLLAASDRRVFYIYAGLILSAIRSERRLLLIGVYTAIILIRLLVRFIIDPPWKKGEAQTDGKVHLESIRQCCNYSSKLIKVE